MRRDDDEETDVREPADPSAQTAVDTPALAEPADPSARAPADPSARTAVDTPALAAPAEAPDRPSESQLTATEIEALPAGARAIDPLRSIQPADAAAAAQIRDIALAASRDIAPAAPRDIALAAPRDEVDLNATIVSKRASSAVEHPRNKVDLNATIVSKRASSAVEHLRDEVLAKLRDGTADDLRDTVDRRRSQDAPTAHKPRPDLLDTLVVGKRPQADVALDAEDLALIARVRALPPEGTEPDWKAMEEAIRAEVRDQPTCLPWWKSWRYLVPLGALAATATIALVVVTAGRQSGERTSLLVPRDAGISDRAPDERIAHETAPALWLDGESFDLDEIEPAQLDEVVPALDDAVLEPNADDAIDANTMLGISDYGWIDTLDDDAAARAESWLRVVP